MRLSAALLFLVSGVAAAAEPPLVVFHAPPGAPAEIAAARDALAQVAASEGTTLVDLSAKPAAEPTAPAALRRGIEAYEAPRYDEALQALGAALAEAKLSGAAGLGPGELSDLLLYRALAHIQRGDTVRAWEDFVPAAVIDPTRRLDPLRFPPRTVEAFERALTKVQGGPRGSVILVDLADGCRAFLDGRPLAGREAASLPYGEHYLRFECPGAAPFGKLVLLSQATHAVKPELPAHRAPNDAEALALAKARGAKSAVFITVGLQGAAGPTLTLRLLGAARGQAFAAPAEAAGALRALIARVVRPPRVPLVPTAPVVVVRETPWYRSPWVWAGVGVGAVIAGAIILPLTLDDAPRTGVPLELDGEVP